MTFWPFNSLGIASHYSGSTITIMKLWEHNWFIDNNKTIYHTNRDSTVNFQAKVIIVF